MCQIPPVKSRLCLKGKPNRCVKSRLCLKGKPNRCVKSRMCLKGKPNRRVKSRLCLQEKSNRRRNLAKKRSAKKFHLHFSLACSINISTKKGLRRLFASYPAELTRAHPIWVGPYIVRTKSKKNGWLVTYFLLRRAPRRRPSHSLRKEESARELSKHGPQKP